MLLVWAINEGGWFGLVNIFMMVGEGLMEKEEGEVRQVAGNGEGVGGVEQ